MKAASSRTSHLPMRCFTSGHPSPAVAVTPGGLPSPAVEVTPQLEGLDH